MLKRAALLLIVLVIVLGVIGLLLPRTWHVERAVRIDTTPDRILPFVANLKRWQDWAVWTKAMDPKVVNTWGGPDEGAAPPHHWPQPLPTRAGPLIGPAPGVDDLRRSEERRVGKECA